MMKVKSALVLLLYTGVMPSLNTKKLKNSSGKSSKIVKKKTKCAIIPGGGSEVRAAGSYNNATTMAGDGDVTKRIHDKDPEIQSYP